MTGTMESLAALKAKLALRAKPFPLWALLHLYETGSRDDLYCDYFAGFKLLIDWLSPIEVDPQIKGKRCKLPKLEYNYEIQEIARHLQIHPCEVYLTWKQYCRTSDSNNSVTVVD